MKYGEISNQHAPVVLIDARLVVEKVLADGIVGWLGKKKVVPFPEALEYMYLLFREGIDVWIVVVPGSDFTRDEVEQCVDSSGLSFSSIIESDRSGRNIDMHLRLDYFFAYFHKGPVPVSTYAPKNKHKNVISLQEVLQEMGRW